MLYVLGRCFTLFPSENEKSPEILEREAVGEFGTCCFRMTLLFRYDLILHEGEAENNSAGRELRYKTAPESLSPEIVLCTLLIASASRPRSFALHGTNPGGHQSSAQRVSPQSSVPSAFLRV